MNDEHKACIADFGLARILGETGFTTKSIGGTCRWMACELVELSEEEEECVPEVTMESDVWAFGMTVLEVRSAVLIIAPAVSFVLYLLSRYSPDGCRSSTSSVTFPLFGLS